MGFYPKHAQVGIQPNTQQTMHISGVLPLHSSLSAASAYQTPVSFNSIQHDFWALGTPPWTAVRNLPVARNPA